MTASRQAATRFIVALGAISLLADVTYEGARSINGPFLGMLGAGAAVVGIVSGAGELAGYVLRLFSGIAVDRTPARDVMLSQASHIVGRGWGFGLHEFMDQMGACAGPLVIALVLAETHQYRRGYALLAIPAGLALATLFTAIKFYPDPSRFEASEATAASFATRLPKAFWIYLAAAGLLAAGFVDFPLIAFHFHKMQLASPAQIPLFYAAAMGVEALMALLFGRLFDRIGIAALIGGAVLSAASSPLAFFGSFYTALAGVALWGAGMGAQQSTLRARIAEMVPMARRGAAYGIFNTAYGVLWFAGSSAIGILYGRSLALAVGFAMAAQSAAIPLLWLARRKHT